MSAHPGDPADRRPLPPFAPALSRPSGSPDAAPAAGALLPPFAPFARPAAAPPVAAPDTPAAEAGSVVDEYARAPEPASAVQEEAAPFTPAAIEAQDEAWMPWEAPEDAGTPRSEAAAAEDDAEDLPWLAAEPAMQAGPVLQEPASGDPAADEVPGWMAWDDEPAVAGPEAEPAAYSFDVDAFDAAPLETPVPDAAPLGTDSFGTDSFDTAVGEPPAFDAEVPFSLGAEPESIAGEPLLYAPEPLDAADAFPKEADDPAPWDSGAPVHVSEAEAAPEAVASPWEAAEDEAGAAEDAGADGWTAGYVADESGAGVGVDAAEEPAAGMEDYFAAEENTAAEEALYAPAADADYAAGSGYTPEYTESASESGYTPEYTESAPEAVGGFHAPEAEPAYAGEAVPFAAAGAGPAALAGGAADALAEVAERLEGIARRLREQPAEVLAGGVGADPLELLVTGFALGYAQGRRGEG